MDPISVTCAVISLATALKDLVALGIRLKKFCDGISKNHKELARLCERIPSDLEELERVYQLNVDIMEQSPSLKIAIEKLIGQLDVISNKFELLSDSQPNASARVSVKLKAAFKASDVEEEIQHLKEDISSSYQSFQTIAIARIEVKLQDISIASQDVPSDLAQVKATTEKTHQAVQQLLALTTDQRIEVQRMKSSIQHQLRRDSSAEIPQASPAIVQVSRPNTLDFLNVQLLNVDEQMFERKDNVKLQLEHLQQPMKPFKQHIPFLSYHRSPEKRNLALLQKVLTLLESLEVDATAVDDHAYILNTLGDHFSSIQMFHEASTVYKWAVDLYRILSAFDLQSFTPFLAETLTSLAWALDEAEADPSDAIDEAIRVLRPLCQTESPPDVRCQFAFQLGIKHRFEKSQGSKEDMLEDFATASSILDSVLREDTRFHQLSSFLEDTDHLSSPPSSILSIWSPQTSAKTGDIEVTGYDAFLLRQANILEAQSYAYSRLGMAHLAETCAVKAVIISSYLISIYPDTNLEFYIACHLNRVSHTISSKWKKIEYRGHALQLIRKAYSFDPKHYSPDLFSVLCNQARSLANVGKRVEAHQHWLEAFQINSRNIKNPLDLAKAYDAAVGNLHVLKLDDEGIEMRIRSAEAFRSMFGRDSIEEVAMLCHLADEYAYLDRRADALRTVMTAIHKWETLPDQETYRDRGQDLASALSLWLELLPKSWSEGIPFDHEAIKFAITQFNQLVNWDIKFLDQYMRAIGGLVSALPDRNTAIQVNMEAITQLQELASNHHVYVTSMLQERWIEHGRLVSSLTIPRM